MSAEHRKPVVAFVVLAFAAAGLVGVQRAEANHGRLLAAVGGQAYAVSGLLPAPRPADAQAARARVARLGPAFEGLLGGADAVTILHTPLTTPRPALDGVASRVSGGSPASGDGSARSASGGRGLVEAARRTGAAEERLAGEAKAGKAKTGKPRTGEAKAGEAKAGEAKAGEAKAGKAKAGKVKGRKREARLPETRRSAAGPAQQARAGARGRAAAAPGKAHGRKSSVQTVRQRSNPPGHRHGTSPRARRG